MRYEHATGLLSIAVVRMPQRHFISEDYGLDPKVFVQFILDKEHSSQSREELVLAIREFLVASDRDAMLKYIDTPVIREVQGRWHPDMSSSRPELPAGLLRPSRRSVLRANFGHPRVQAEQ